MATIGGLTPTPGTGPGDVISGNSGYNISIFEARPQAIEGYIIGLNAAGTAPLGVSTTGIYIYDTQNPIVSGMSQGVLGCYDEANAPATIVRGWNWYAGADPSQIGADQYDFETTVTHELGHALGLGHSLDPSSPMYASVAAGVTDRIPTLPDLDIPAPPPVPTRRWRPGSPPRRPLPAPTRWFLHRSPSRSCSCRRAWRP